MADTTREGMTAAEYAQLPETNTPTELIDGVLIASPTPFNRHQRIVGKIYLLLHASTQTMELQGEVVISPMDVHLDEYNIVQPDVFWVSGAESRCQLGEDDYWHGAPDLAVEVLSKSTARRDQREKFALYEKHGTREYWIVSPDYQTVEVFVREGDTLSRLGVYGPEAPFESPVLGGQTVDLSGVFRGAFDV